MSAAAVWSVGHRLRPLPCQARNARLPRPTGPRHLTSTGYPRVRGAGGAACMVSAQRGFAAAVVDMPVLRRTQGLAEVAGRLATQLLRSLRCEAAVRGLVACARGLPRLIPNGAPVAEPV
jgi:hypothetical protein